MDWFPVELLWSVCVEWAISFLVTVLCLWLVYWLQTPYDYLKDLTDIGYWHIRGLRPGNVSKALEVERRRKTRSAGDRLPPPFPNGWYMVAESKEVLKGKAISVDLVGMTRLSKPTHLTSYQSQPFAV